jgi:hypothetical protein
MPHRNRRAQARALIAPTWRAFWLGAAIVALAIVWRAASAGPVSQALFPLLVNLAGWEAGEPEGEELALSGGTISAATRSYARGGKEITANIVVGGFAEAARSLALPASAVKERYSTLNGEQELVVRNVDGFRVQMAADRSAGTGTVVVVLSDSAVFGLAFDGLSPDEALVLARRFDWQAMRARVAAES